MLERRGLSTRVVLGVAATASLVLGSSAAAVAESVRAAVGNHVANELAKEPESSPSSPSTDDGVPGGADADAGGLQTAAPAPAPAARPGPLLFGRKVHFDVGVESRVQVWLPAQHPSVHLAAAPYRTYSLEVSGEIEGLLALHRLAFETDGSTWIGSTGPAVSPASGASALGTAAALATIGLPFLRLGGPSWWEPIVRYEVASYATTATPSRSVCLVARDADTSADPPACTRTDGALRMASRFESLVIGAQFGAAGGPAFLLAGLDIVSQRKPYQVNVAGRTLDDYLFDARFSGGGVALELGLGRDEGLSFRGGFHFGWATVSLTDDLALEDVLPGDWSLEYLRWDTALGYGRVLWKGPPIVSLHAALDATGTYFIYARDDSEETPSLSRDIFLSGRVALMLTL